MRVLRSSGFSLVGVLVASAMVGGLSLMVAKLMQNSSKTIRTTEVGLGALDYIALLEDTFKNKDACTNTFGRIINSASSVVREGMPLSDDNILLSNNISGLGASGILNADGETLWEEGEDVIGGLRLRSVKIPEDKLKPDGSVVDNFTPISSALSTGFVEVHVELEKSGKAAKSYGGRTKTLKLNLTVEVYGSRKRINSCQLAGQASSITVGPNIKSYGYYVYTTRQSVNGSNLSMSITCPVGGRALGAQGVIARSNTITCFDNNYNGVKNESSRAQPALRLDRVSLTYSYNNQKRESLCGYLVLHCLEDSSSSGTASYSSSCTNGCSNIKKGSLEDLGWN